MAEDSVSLDREHSTSLDGEHPPSIDAPSPRSSEDGIEGPIPFPSSVSSSASSLAPSASPYTRPRPPRNYLPSPLNPHGQLPHLPPPITRPFASGSATEPRSTSITRIASEETHALTAGTPAGGATMVLYRLATFGDDHAPADGGLPRPGTDAGTASWHASSLFALPADSKYPLAGASPRRLVPYAYDPLSELPFLASRPPSAASRAAEDDDADDDDWDVADAGKPCVLSWRGVINIGALALVLGAILALFISYPVITFYRGDPRTRDVSAVGYVGVADASAASAAASAAIKAGE